VSLFASGSEVEIAMHAKVALDAAGLRARVISVPCFELFEMQGDAYRNSVLGTASVNVGIEAAIRQGWDAIIGSNGIFIGMDGFGASAPYKELYNHFGITVEAVVDAVQARLTKTAD
jgi:transketolase